MRILLLDNIRGVGHIGDVKDVRDGYARNFLFPRQLAKLADKSTEKEVEALKQKRVLLIEKEQKQMQEAAERLKDVSLELAGRANETGTLFAGIGKKEVAHAIQEKVGVLLDDDMIILPDHIKTLGTHQVEIRLTEDISVPITITVIPASTAE